MLISLAWVSKSPPIFWIGSATWSVSVVASVVAVVLVLVRPASVSPLIVSLVCWNWPIVLSISVSAAAMFSSIRLSGKTPISSPILAICWSIKVETRWRLSSTWAAAVWAIWSIAWSAAGSSWSTWVRESWWARSASRRALCSSVVIFSRLVRTASLMRVAASWRTFWMFSWPLVNTSTNFSAVVWPSERSLVARSRASWRARLAVSLPAVVISEAACSASCEASPAISPGLPEARARASAALLLLSVVARWAWVSPASVAEVALASARVRASLCLSVSACWRFWSSVVAACSIAWSAVCWRWVIAVRACSAAARMRSLVWVTVWFRRSRSASIACWACCLLVSARVWMSCLSVSAVVVAVWRLVLERSTNCAKAV